MSSNPPTTAPKPFVFVLMPFRDDFRDVYDVAIKGAASEVGAYAERVDEQHFTDSILDRVLNQISKADALVADMTGMNPNVYYEVGYAHAISKPVLLITQEINDIPFDLKHRPHTEYKRTNLSKLRTDLIPKIAAALNESKHGKRLNTPCPVEVRVSGHMIPEVGLGDRPVIQCATFDPKNGQSELKLSLANVASPSPFVLDQIHLLTHVTSQLQPTNGFGLAEPIWFDSTTGVHESFSRRFLLERSEIPLPYYGVHELDRMLRFAEGEEYAQLRIELLGEGRRFQFDFVARR